MAWLSADMALQRLGVRAQTLYAYASRGRVQVRADPADPRRSLYRSADVDALLERQTRSRRRAAVAESTIDWGEPVLESAITLIAGGRLIYRGADAAQLAETEALETVARRLWAAPASPSPFPHSAAAQPSGGMRELFALLARAAAGAAAQRGRPTADLAVEAERLAGAVLAVFAGGGEGFAHDRLAQAWGAPAAAQPIRRALVLAADHELNASAFAARLAASTGAGLPACVLAGLATLSGPAHGGVTTEMGRLFRAARRLGPETALGRWSQRNAGVAPPGFGHRLYPEGDPRADALLSALGSPPLVATLRQTGEAATGQPVNFDFALGALAVVHGLPVDAPRVLFTVARTCGWLAHALEQTATARLIRPRARYTGPPPPPPEPADNIVLGGRWD